MELNDALGAIRKGVGLIVAGLLVGLAAAGLISALTPRTYASETQLFVSAVDTPGTTTNPYNNDLFSQQRAVSYVQILTGEELAGAVVDELGLETGAEDLLQQIEVVPLPGTVVLEVRVTDTSPERAQQIAAAVAREFVQQVTDLETRAGAAIPAVDVRTIQAADFNPEPVSPDIVRNLAVGAALGLVLGLALALLRGRLDRSVRTDEEIRAAAGTEVLGRVAADRSLAKHHVAYGAGDHSPAAEAFRALRLKLQHGDPTVPPRVVVVTASNSGEGTSTVAVNLSVSLARSGSRVMLVDANLRRPRVARYLGLTEDGAGLTDVLADTADLHQATQRWTDSRLSVLDAGPLSVDSDEILGSPQMRRLLSQLREAYDFVIIDAPPLLPVVDAAALSVLADGCVLVAEFASTKREHLVEAASAVTRVRADLLGVVLNRVPKKAIAAPGGRRRYAADSGRRRAPSPLSTSDEERAGSRQAHPPVPVPSRVQE
ncbi:polysaccharide biosynthesis tyrosine autokinase [Blastococcus sp. SYSU DS0973]